MLTFASERQSVAQECPEGSVLSDNGVTCELDVSADDPICPEGQELDAAGLLCVPIVTTDPNAICPEGQQLDAAGLLCEAIPVIPDDSPCPPGQELNAVGLQCIPIEGADGEAGPSAACDEGYSLGSDGETCIADGPSCGRGEVLDDRGECVQTFQCPDDLILASDLLSCISDRCPDDELLSVDGKRCVAPDSDCPDGSPRPIGGACLVVETIEGADGETEVVVRCAEADSFCQAQVKQCADDRAAGISDLGTECADPRGACDETDDQCTASNDRLVECATRDLTETEDGEPIKIGGRDDPCTDLCPTLHRLDASGECIEYLDPKHPCVISGTVPRRVTTNRELDGYSFLAGLGQCVTRSEFLRRLGNFEAAAGAEADALTLLRETTSAYLTVEGQLAELENLLAEAESQIEEFTQDAAEADQRRRDNARLLVSTQKQLDREQALLREEVRQVFVSGGNDALVEEAILSANNVTEISVVRLYGRVLLDDQIANIERVEQLEKETQELAVSLDRAAAEVEASLAAAIESAESLETLQGEAEALRAEQIERRDVEAELVAELREDKATFAQELGIFEQATLEITAIIEQTEFRVTTFAEFDGLLANPILPRTRISSGFGPRLHPILGYVRNHNGVDISAGFGEDILASGPGIVQIASGFGGYGQTVVIDHGGDLLTLYAHMSVILVEAGDEVELGDTIGLVGSTGLSTGPHLHFEVWEEGNRAVDPRPYLSDAE
jgi:murein DD-endopeptidase MepM/ murein hydrolase activator NlpD